MLLNLIETINIGAIWNTKVKLFKNNLLIERKYEGVADRESQASFKINSVCEGAAFERLFVDTFIHIWISETKAILHLLINYKGGGVKCINVLTKSSCNTL